MKRSQLASAFGWVFETIGFAIDFGVDSTDVGLTELASVLGSLYAVVGVVNLVGGTNFGDLLTGFRVPGDFSCDVTLTLV
jgi:hypothetical protein